MHFLTHQPYGDKATVIYMKNDQNKGASLILAPGRQSDMQQSTEPLNIQVPSETIHKVEFNGVEGTTEEDKILLIKQYIRNKVLKQFGVAEIAKTPVTGGRLYFNDGNRNSLKLPRVKETTSGAFAENLEQYYNRCKPMIHKWLQQSYQTSGITPEAVNALG